MEREDGDVRAFHLKYSAAEEAKSRQKDSTFFAPNVQAGIQKLGMVVVAFRLRLDSVQNTLKPTKPYVLLKDTLTVKAGVPVRIC